MEYKKLGRTGLFVSRLCLGTMNFGDATDRESAFRIMDAAYDAGINFFDTADVYGGPQRPDIPLGYGVSEEILGDWFQKSGKRDEIVLATKVYQPMIAGPNGGRLSAYHIRKACEDSLRRLKTDHIDLYQMHHFDRLTPWEEIWSAMETLVRQGKVLYVGCCNFPGWGIAAAQGEAHMRSFMGLVSEQSRYSLACRAIELEVLPSARWNGMGVLTYSPLDGGLLAGALKKAAEKSRRRKPSLPIRDPKFYDRVAAYEKLCDEYGLAPADVAQAWVLANPDVTCPIVGPRTVEQLEGSVKGLDVKLSEEMMKRLDEIFPGPGGEAPEAYAW